MALLSRLLNLFAVAFVGFAIAAGPALAGDSYINTKTGGLFGGSGPAIKGYDPVAYFTESQAVKGQEAHSYSWKGAEWLFASAENKKKFVANPEKYAPQYGGYCAFAITKGQTASIDPEAWHISDGKLYLNLSKSIQDRWLANKDSFIDQANRNWPDIKADLSS